MKKIIIFPIMFMLIFPFATLSVRAEDGAEDMLVPLTLSSDTSVSEEKILTPAEIKNFKDIKKIGNVLFGVRIEKKIEKMENQEKKIKQEKLEIRNTQDKPEMDKSIEITASSSVLEKISSPLEISLFNKIKKIGTALWGVRKNEIQKPINNQKLVYVTPSAVECVKNAIDKKDTAIKASTSKHSQAIIAAIDTRNACQKAALEKTTAKEQFETNKVCINAFQKGAKENNMTIEKERNEAHKTYRTDLKSCSNLQLTSTSTSASLTANEIKIEDGEGAAE